MFTVHINLTLLILFLSVDDSTVREGLRLQRGGFPPKYRVEEFSGNSGAHSTLGVYENGEFSWPRYKNKIFLCTFLILNIRSRSWEHVIFSASPRH